MITNPKCINLDDQITEHFKWREALLLREWSFFAHPRPQEAYYITKTCLKLEEIRLLIDAPIYITSFFRPPQYNDFIGGSTSSYHTKGLAADFYTPKGKSSDLREYLKKYVDTLQIRLEDLPKDKDWVHIDLGEPVSGNRIFKP